MSDPWQRRAVSAEINGRRVNEAIERGGHGSSGVFVCECGYADCSNTIELSIAEYEAVRTNFDRFLVVPEHVIASVDSVVEEHPTYLVVVKREGEPKQMAREADAREA